MKIFGYRFILSIWSTTLCLGITQVIPPDFAFGMDDNIPSAKQESTEDGDDLSVHLTVDSSQVNPMVRERYQIFLKADPQNPQSQKILFPLTKEKETTGDVTLKGVKDANELQIFVVKDTYQRDCMPDDDNLKEKMAKTGTSTITEMPHSLSIKLSQTDTQLKETDEKKFSGYDAVPSCKIIEIDDEGEAEEHS